MKKSCEEGLREKAELLLDLTSSGKTLVTGHRNADPDALASAYVVASLLSRKNRVAHISFPEGVSHASKRVTSALGLNLESITRSKEDVMRDYYAAVIAVDTASVEQLGEYSKLFREGGARLIVVDHHSYNTLVEEASLAIYCPNAKATAEIVYLLSTTIGENLNREEAELLLAGMIYDTKRFLIATAKTFHIASKLLENGASLDNVLKALQPEPPDISERIARLKAAQRMHVIRADDLLVAVSRVSAFEASAARGILDLGADLAVIVSPQGPSVRIVARARRSFVKETGINLGRDLVQALGGSSTGGGHDQAAAAIIRMTIDQAINHVVVKIKEMLKDRGYQPTIIV